MDVSKIRVVMWRLLGVPDNRPEYATILTIKGIYQDRTVWFYGDPEDWLVFREESCYKDTVKACGDLLTWLEKQRQVICHEYRAHGTVEWEENSDSPSAVRLAELIKSD